MRKGKNYLGIRYINFGAFIIRFKEKQVQKLYFFDIII